MRVANSAVVLATTKTFLQLTKEDADLQRQVYLRLKTPMLTVGGGANAALRVVLMMAGDGGSLRLSNGSCGFDRCVGSF